ncbi:MAG: hypothetical protein JOY79_08235, partial [Acidobacteriaceae bacterium]|nr:hypothetical protein [Acidobacteriaceae bacterium]
MRWHRQVALALVALLVTPLLLGQGHTVDQSVHNLSITGPGTVKSTTETGVCIFCHVPHGAIPKAELWNRQLPGDIYQQYGSTTYTQTNNPISTQSKLCLSCHDGTIALGQTLATGDLNIPSLMPAANKLGTNLAADHPISFTLPAQDDREIASWLLSTPLNSPDPAITLQSGKVECTTCHDPHSPDRDPIAQKFLRRSN